MKENHETKMNGFNNFAHKYKAHPMYVRLNRMRGLIGRYAKNLTARSKVLIALNLVVLLYTVFVFSKRSYGSNEDSLIPANLEMRDLFEAKRGPGADDLGALVDILGLEDENEFFDMFEDAQEYLAAPNVKVLPYTKSDYVKRWNRLYAHVQYFSTHIHKRYVPRLNQQLSPEKFIKTFMFTSTPVIIPSAMFKHLNYTVPAYDSLESLAAAFPEMPDPSVTGREFQGYIWSGLQKHMLNLRPAVKYLTEQKLDVEGRREGDETCYKKGNVKFCWYPRNTKLDVKHLRHLGIDRPPPFLWPRCYQNPSIWMAPPKHHTSNHHDASDNFIVHVLGIKRWMLFPPVDSKFMYRFCIQKGLCKARIKHPDTPQTEEARRIVNTLANPIIVDVRPGDVLYLPNGWFHHVEAVDGTTTLIANFWTKLDFMANGALQRGLKNQTWEHIHKGIYTVINKGNRKVVIRK